MGPMEKLHLDFVQARDECDRAITVASNILARTSRAVEETGAAIRESEAKIAKSKQLLNKLRLRGLYGEGD
jgi:hypothetical protein